MGQEIKSYKDLVVWQRAMEAVEMTYALAQRLPDDEKFGLISQMKRAAVSVPANIAEGHGSQLRKVYLKHLAIARGSLMELETYVDLVQRLGYVQPVDAEELQKYIDETGKMINGLGKALKDKG